MDEKYSAFFNGAGQIFAGMLFYNVARFIVDAALTRNK